MIERLSPAVAIYENVKGAIQKQKDNKGIVQRPCVEALIDMGMGRRASENRGTPKFSIYK